MLISVIIPARNASGTLGSCLEALQRSTWRDYECIVVDDGSTDDTAEVARRFGVRVVRLDPGRGPAAARNRGAAAAEGEVLFFVDADVCVHPDAMERMAAHLMSGPGGVHDPDRAPRDGARGSARRVDAVFGSYDDAPPAPGFFSRFKNLMHHYVHHRHASPDARTFWAGCGAVRKDVFLAAGGFNEAYRDSSIEDIELGYRLSDAGHRIVLDPRVQGSHLKRWTFRSMVWTDVRRRALPWLRLLFRRRAVGDDLNVDRRHRASVALLLGALLTALPSATALAFDALRVSAAATLALAAFLTGAVVFLNRDLYGFFRRKEGIGFAARAIPVHLLYFFYCGASAIWVLLCPSDAPALRPSSRSPRAADARTA